MADIAGKQTVLWKKGVWFGVADGVGMWIWPYASRKETHSKENFVVVK